MNPEEEAEGEVEVYIGVYGYWLWEAPHYFEESELSGLTEFPPDDGWDLVTMIPGDGSDPTEGHLRELCQRARGGDVKPRDTRRLLVLAIGRGDRMDVGPFTTPGLDRGG